MPNYQNGKIYKIQLGDHFYIGATTLSLTQRFANHKQDMNRTSEFYGKFREVGADNCTISLIETVSCDSREELGQREQIHIAQHMQNPLCLNRRAGHRSHDEKLAQAKQWKQNKHACACGKTVSRGNLASHNRSKSHLAAMGDN